MIGLNDRVHTCSFIPPFKERSLTFIASISNLIGKNGWMVLQQAKKNKIET